ncbi:ATP-binding protein [Sphaerotilus sp.]|uniref:AAA family ATPase n=1 Tax=Sphaerotilus sp. TaxID=2093942 RepID=UPI002ACED9D5|nr:ATP-binding protein [Sphaerotilus sp.]MDZ7855086.1 ATP-binding protein [Sphaerotilus sp.]
MTSALGSSTTADGLDLSPTLDARYTPVIQRWILRVLFSFRGIDQLVQEHFLGDEDVAFFLGLNNKKAHDADKVRRQLQALQADLERLQPVLPTDTTLAMNIARLGDRLGLNVIERDLLHVVVLQRLHNELNSALNLAGDLSRTELVQLLATCLPSGSHRIRMALAPQSGLCRSALISVDDDRRYRFNDKVDLLEGLVDALQQGPVDLLDLFPAMVVRPSPPTLNREDFAHVQEDVHILSAYLASSAQQGRMGLNVLIHGRSGTGKTQFVRMLAQATGLQLLEIPVHLPDGRPNGGKARFNSFRFAQNLLRNTASPALLFDEAEDVFEGSQPNSSGIKGWVHHVLEHNPVLTFWVTSDLDGLDPAYRRRFDYVLELEMPPERVRRHMLEQHLRAHDLPLSPAWIAQAARHEALGPGLIQRAAKVCAAVTGTEGCTMGAEQVLTRVMNNTLQAMDAPRLPATVTARGGYRLDWLNADTNLPSLRDGLLREGSGRLCLWGPPGTGKTEFGRHMADTLGRPLLVRKASDLLSPYVGMAEKQMAQMFDQARRDGSVLLLDEADSFLMDRRSAQRPWEITQVNEMLTQMEAFDGLFIASTNLIEQIDQAAMRRFDLCIRFGPLKAEQALEMFQELVGAWGWAADVHSLSMIAALDLLTPGDFAAVRRGARLNVPQDSAALAQRLKQACAIKPGRPSRGIGFLDSLDHTRDLSLQIDSHAPI